MFRLFFHCLLTIILLFVVMKLFDLNRNHQKQYERFVSDFDEVMDNKCLTDTNFQKDNYLFSGVCIKNTCEPERCDQLVCNDQDNECQFMYSVAPKTSITDDNGNFSCITKEDIPNHIYCSGVDSIPVCDRLGEEDFCYEYDNHSKTWERESYKKHYISTGECVWMNKTRNTVLEDEEYLVNCRKTPLDCSLCNLPCAELPEIDLTAPGLDITSLFADNFEKYIIRSNADGLSCVPDESHSCFECDESMTKVAYKLISNERRFETKFYGKQNVSGMCLYMNGDECHPDHAEEPRAQSRCSFDTGMFSEKVECTQNDYRYCCNLDERDFFKITQYEPALSSDGTKCVYVTVDDSLDRELVSTDPSGFSCPGYDFRLCQDPNEFRNVVEQRCTPCPEGEYLKHRNNFTAPTACEELPNCSGETNTEYCFEDMNEAGTIQIRRAYQKEPHATYSTDDMVLPTASCESTAPSDCRRTCSDPENPDGIELNTADYDSIQKDFYCDQCPTGQKINPNTFECETTIDCPSESKVECLNRHENTIKEYYKRQDDEFSPCMYVSVDDYDRIDTSECTNSCDPGYIKGTDNKCVLASCRFNRAYTITGPENDIPSLYEAEKINMFDTIDKNYDVKYHSDNCHIEEIIQSISIKAFDPCDLHTELVECQTSKSPATVCQVDHDTINQLRNEDMLGDVNVSLGDLMVADTSIQKLSSKDGANGDCPVDCLYNSSHIVYYDMDVCKDRVNGKVDYYLGDEIKKGTKQKRYNRSQDQNRFGDSCGQARIDLYAAIGKTPSDVAYNYDDHIIVESTCDLPKRNVPCQTDEDCDACTETDTCVFQQSCMRRITLQPFGDGSGCDPEPGSFVKVCANSCANCEEYGKSVWKRTADQSQEGVPITESEWSGLINTPLENSSHRYTRKLIATENCMYQNPDDLTAEREPKAANNVLRIESSNVGKRPLDRDLDNIQEICDRDTSYANWTPKNRIDCSCDSKNPVREVGDLRTDLTVRGFSITSSDCSGNDCPANHCPATFERQKSCSDHYNSRIPCGLHRDNIAESERLRYCSNGDNWNWSFHACPTNDCYPGGYIDGQPETDRSPDYECYPSDITTPKPTSNCPPAPFCLADKLEYCSNINNWDWSYTCPTEDCYLGGPVDGVPTLITPSPYECVEDDISESDYPSSNCPANCDLIIDSIEKRDGFTTYIDSIRMDHFDGNLDNLFLEIGIVERISVVNVLSEVNITRPNILDPDIQHYVIDLNSGPGTLVYDNTTKNISRNYNTLNTPLLEINFPFPLLSPNKDYDIKLGLTKKVGNQYICSGNNDGHTGCLQNIRYGVNIDLNAEPLLQDGFYKINLTTQRYLNKDLEETTNPSVFKLTNQILSGTTNLIELTSEGHTYLVKILLVRPNNVFHIYTDTTDSLYTAPKQVNTSIWIAKRVSSNVLIDEFTFEPIDTLNLCQNPNSFDFNCSAPQQNCGQSVAGVLKSEYREIDCSGAGDVFQACADYIECITINSVNITQTNRVMTVNSMNISYESSFDWDNLYLEIGIMNIDPNWITDFECSIQKTAESDSDHYIIKLDNTNWSLAYNGSLTSTNPFTITINDDPGTYYLHMGFTRKNTDGGFISCSNWGQTGCLQITSLFTFEDANCIPYNGQCAYPHNDSVVYLGVCCDGASCDQVTNNIWACR